MYFPGANGLAFATCGPVNCKTLFQNLIKLNSMKLRLSTVDFPQSLKGMRKESFDSYLLLHFVLIQYFSVANPVLQIRRGGGGGSQGGPSPSDSSPGSATVFIFLTISI